MGYYHLKTTILEHTIEYLSKELSVFGYRYDSLINYVIKKEESLIFGFRYMHELYILIKLIEDSGYIKHEDNNIKFKIVKPVEPNIKISDILKKLPYLLSETELDNICIGETMSNYLDWYNTNKQTLEKYNCLFLHWA